MRLGLDTTFLVQAEILEHPGHAAARREVEARLAAGDGFVLAPQVLAEFVHVVSDPRRFERPLPVAQALDRAMGWWQAAEVEPVAPTPEAVALFDRWMRSFGLGRGRLLDTMLAATYHVHGIRTILSSNARDYAVFGCFDVVIPA